MGLFYRMVATYVWHEKVLARFRPAPEDRARLRQAMWRALGVRFRAAAIDMGGLLIKAGQLLSARADIFPPEFTRELAALQDTVPGVPYAAVRAAVEREFDAPLERVFPRFDAEPLAAASLGQVHRAALPDGTEVAVKVLRPGVEDLIRADLEGTRRVVRFLLRWTRWARGLDLPGLYYECYHVLLRELDLREEARHTQRFAKMFQDVPGIVVPPVFEDYTRERVLTLGFVAGIKLSDRAAMDAAGIPPAAVAQLLISALSRQVLTEGFFHADPHPGNLLVQPGPTLVLLDFGMVGQLTPRHREAFKRIGLGLLRRDPDGVIQGFEELEMIRPTADRGALRRAIAWLFEKQLHGDIFSLRPEDFLEVARELRAIIYSQAFQFPSDIAFLGRAAGTTFGVCRTLDPGGDFIAGVENAVKAYLKPGEEVGRSLVDLAGQLSRMPARFERVLSVLERGGARPLGGGGDAGARRSLAPAGLLVAAVGFVGGNQWWAQGEAGVAAACWAVAAAASSLWLFRRLPPSPPEP